MRERELVLLVVGVDVRDGGGDRLRDGPPDARGSPVPNPGWMATLRNCVPGAARATSRTTRVTVLISKSFDRDAVYSMKTLFDAPE